MTGDYHTAQDREAGMLAGRKPPPFGHEAMNQLKPDRVLLRAAVDELVASGFRDPEGLFYQVIHLAHAGDFDRAVEIFADVVKRGFYPYETFLRHAWLDPLRNRQEFAAILEIARGNSEGAHAAFVNAGRKTLLGVEG